MSLKRIVVPQAEPVSVQEAQNHLRTDEDAELIQALIVAAREYVENFIRRALVTQTWELGIDVFPSGQGVIVVPMPPLQSVESITFFDDEGNQLAIDSTEYIVDNHSEPGRIIPVQTWPIGNNVRIQFVAGYGDATAVPQSIKQAILLLVGRWYETRADGLSVDSINGVGSVQWGGQSVADALLWPYRDLRLA